MEQLRLKMVRESLGGIPDFALPAPYSFRWYEPGDEAAWVEIQAAADRYNRVTPALFASQFGSMPGELHRRQGYLCDSGRTPIGTATAWSSGDYYGRAYGRLHWVAIVPAFQGQGLAKPLLSAVCKRLAELGPDRAYLTTATVRIPAVNLYTTFGFDPDIRGPGDRHAWRQLLDAPLEQGVSPRLRHALSERLGVPVRGQE